jgi:hypothetical protein
MDSDQDRRTAGLLLFFLGGVTATYFAMRWSRQEGAGNTIERVQSVLDETVEGVESAAAYVRTLIEPVHDLLDEASALAGGVKRTLSSYKQLGSRDAYTPSMAPQAERGAGPS